MTESAQPEQNRHRMLFTDHGDLLKEVPVVPMLKRHQVQVFEPELSDLHRQILDLMRLPHAVFCGAS